MGKQKITRSDYIKANRKASREAEIENHQHPVHFNRVHQSKKVYDRNRMKADDKRHLPLFFALCFFNVFVYLSQFERIKDTYKAIEYHGGGKDGHDHRTGKCRIDDHQERQNNA